MDRGYLASLGLSEEAMNSVMQAFEAYAAEQASAYEAQQQAAAMESALNQAILHSGAYDPKAVLPFLALDQVSFENNGFVGLEEQLSRLRESKGFLFQQAPPKAGFLTGMTHQGFAPMSNAGMSDAQYYAKFGA